MSDTGIKPQTGGDGHTPYSRYVQTEVLHTLQEFVSDSPAEPAFLANVQISEIYWALITRELMTAQTELRSDKIAATNRVPSPHRQSHGSIQCKLEISVLADACRTDAYPERAER